MLYDMMQTPTDWKRHIERFTNSLVMAIVYGLRSPDINSQYLQRFEVLLRQWAEINAFGATPPVDVVPILNWVPERFLGNWKSRAQVVHDEMRQLYDGLHKLVLRRRQRLGSTNSIIDRLLDQRENNPLTDHQISNLAGVTIKGGSDTSASILASFVLAMVLHPEIQKKAQAEIDRVIPDDRVPDVSDSDRLPYVMSIIKETQRWRPIVGIGVPHQLSEGQCKCRLEDELGSDMSQMYGWTISYFPTVRCCYSMCGDCITTRNDTPILIHLTRIGTRIGQHILQNMPTKQIRICAIIMHMVTFPVSTPANPRSLTIGSRQWPTSLPRHTSRRA